MFPALLVAITLLQPAFTPGDARTIVRTVVDSTIAEIRPMEPSIASRRVYADPRRLAEAVRQGVRSDILTGGQAELPAGFATFDEQATDACMLARGSSSCRADDAAYFYLKRMTRTDRDQIEVLGFLVYPISAAHPASENGARPRLQGTVHAVLTRDGGTWRITRLSVATAG